MSSLKLLLIPCTVTISHFQFTSDHILLIPYFCSHTWKDISKPIIWFDAHSQLRRVEEPEGLREGAGVGYPQHHRGVLINHTVSKVKARGVKYEVRCGDLCPEGEVDGQALVGDVELQGRSDRGDSRGWLIRRIPCEAPN